MLTKKQENRYRAYGNLYQALTLDPAPYQADQAMKDFVARLGVGLAGIEANLVPGTRATKGQTKDKDAVRDTLALVAAELAGDLFAYATKIQSATLQAEADYSKSDLLVMSGTRLAAATELLAQRLQDHLAALAEYTVDAARIQELTAARAAFLAQRNNPRQQMGANAAVRLTTGEYFRQLGTLLTDEFQRALRKYARRAPAFHARIVSAREVLDLRGPGAATPPAAPQP